VEDWFMDNEGFLTELLRSHSGEVLILTLAVLLVFALLLILPMLLRHHLRKAEMTHQEHLRALERGLPLPPEDYRARMAGRTALLVPIIVMVTAGVVTAFLIAYKSETMFAASLAIWVVAGVVSLAAITGGVALVGRLAQIQSGEEEDEEEESRYLNS
jgi:hypothetical protein